MVSLNIYFSANNDNFSDESKVVREIVDYSFQQHNYKGHKEQDEFLIAYTIEKARWLQFQDGSHVVIEKPEHENAYIGIGIHQVSTLNFLTKLKVCVRIKDQDGNLIGQKKHFYHARPTFHHYGRNWILPGDGFYDLTICIEMTPEQRSSLTKDDIESEYVEVSFPHIWIETGQQLS